ncbi:MAG: hypothetical protein HRU19_11340 [Pseudobacteriovorax sp.]|nr:hypothetical protein [Pseudobacteriovorax sp.]
MGASGLGSLLVMEGLLTEQDRRTIASTCGQNSWAFAKSILAMGMLDEDELAAFFADHTKYQVAKRDFIDKIDTKVLQSIDARMLARIEMLPIKVNRDTIEVAVVDPLDRGTIRQLEFFTGLTVLPVIAPISQIYEGLAKLIDKFEPYSTDLKDFLKNHAATAWQRQRIEESASQLGQKLPQMSDSQSPNAGASQEPIRDQANSEDFAASLDDDDVESLDDEFDDLDLEDNDEGSLELSDSLEGDSLESDAFDFDASHDGIVDDANDGDLGTESQGGDDPFGDDLGLDKALAQAEEDGDALDSSVQDDDPFTADAADDDLAVASAGDDDFAGGSSLEDDFDGDDLNEPEDDASGESADLEDFGLSDSDLGEEEPQQDHDTGMDADLDAFGLDSSDLDHHDPQEDASGEATDLEAKSPAEIADDVPDSGELQDELSGFDLGETEDDVDDEPGLEASSETMDDSDPLSEESPDLETLDDPELADEAEAQTAKSPAEIADDVPDSDEPQDELSGFDLGEVDEETDPDDVMDDDLDKSLDVSEQKPDYSDVESDDDFSDDLLDSEAAPAEELSAKAADDDDLVAQADALDDEFGDDSLMASESDDLAIPPQDTASDDIDEDFSDPDFDLDVMSRPAEDEVAEEDSEDHSLSASIDDDLMSLEDEPEPKPDVSLHQGESTDDTMMEPMIDDNLSLDDESHEPGLDSDGVLADATGDDEPVVETAHHGEELAEDFDDLGQEDLDDFEADTEPEADPEPEPLSDPTEDEMPLVTTMSKLDSDDNESELEDDEFAAAEVTSEEADVSDMPETIPSPQSLKKIKKAEKELKATKQTASTINQGLVKISLCFNSDKALQVTIDHLRKVYSHGAIMYRKGASKHSGHLWYEGQQQPWEDAIAEQLTSQLGATAGWQDFELESDRLEGLKHAVGTSLKNQKDVELYFIGNAESKPNADLLDSTASLLGAFAQKV